MRKAIFGVFGLLFILILINGVLAVPPTPSAFYGSVQDSDGDDVLEGYITAKINGVISGVGVVSEGTYGYSSNSLIVLAYNKLVGQIEFYYGEEKIGEHDFIDMGVTNLDFIVNSLGGSQNPVDGFCDVTADECLYNALDCNPEKTDACLGNYRCDIEIGENCVNSQLDCGSCVVNDPNSGNDNGGSPRGSPGGGGDALATITTTNSGEDDEENETINLNDDSGLGFLQTTTEDEPNTFSRITGAVTGTFGVVGTWIIFIFLIGVIGSAITVRQIRKRKRL